MPIFYVYLNWYSDSNPNSAGYHRQLLICESRQIADEFYRSLEVSETGGRKWFTVLQRSTPQLWQYDSSDGWVAVIGFLRTRANAQFARKIISVLLNDAGGRDWPIIPVHEGPDWVNNGTYFIRNRRQPEQYWYYSAGYLLVSTTEKTKFRVRGKAFAKEDPKVLIDSDLVNVSLAGCAKPKVYFSKQTGTNKLTMSTDGNDWRFGDFRTGFGSVNHCDGMMERVITWADDDDGDEWELC